MYHFNTFIWYLPLGPLRDTEMNKEKEIVYKEPNNILFDIYESILDIKMLPLVKLILTITRLTYILTFLQLHAHTLR